MLAGTSTFEEYGRGWSGTGNTLAPLATERAIWRRLKARAHPDAGGDHELFLFVKALEERLAGDVVVPTISEPPHRPGTADEAPRVPFEWDVPHEELVRRALLVAHDVLEPYASLLRLLSSYRGAVSPAMRREERRGPTYRLLAAIGHAAGMTPRQRRSWYRIAERAGLSARAGAYIFDRLKEVTL